MHYSRAQPECMNIFSADVEIKSAAAKALLHLQNFFTRANSYGVIYVFVCSALIGLAIFVFCAPQKFAMQNFAFRRKSLRP